MAPLSTGFSEVDTSSELSREVGGKRSLVLEPDSSNSNDEVFGLYGIQCLLRKYEESGHTDSISCFQLPRP